MDNISELNNGVVTDLNGNTLLEYDYKPITVKNFINNYKCKFKHCHNKFVEIYFIVNDKKLTINDLIQKEMTIVFVFNINFRSIYQNLFNAKTKNDYLFSVETPTGETYDLGCFKNGDHAIINSDLYIYYMNFDNYSINMVEYESSNYYIVDTKINIDTIIPSKCTFNLKLFR